MLLFRGLVYAERCIPIAAGLLCLHLCWPISLLGTAEAVVMHPNLPPLCLEQYPPGEQRGAWVVVGGKSFGLGTAF